MDTISEFYGGQRYFGYWSTPLPYGNQFLVSNREKVVEYINEYNGACNCGISISTIIDEVPFLLYLTFDFDDGDLKKTWDDASKLYNFCIDCGYDVSIHYSGYRGFHVLISTEPHPYTKPQVRIAHKFFAEVLDLKTCDKALFGDVRRLIRIPGTVHCGKFKKVNNHYERLGEGGICYEVADSPGELLNLDEFIDEDIYEPLEVTTTRDDIRIYYHEYPCLEKHIRNEEPPHIIRYSYVAYLLRTGVTPDEIIQLLESRHSPGKEYEWNDWNEYYTIKQVEQLAGGFYHPLTCNSLKELGYCLPECPYNLDGWKVKNVRDIIS